MIKIHATTKFLYIYVEHILNKLTSEVGVLSPGDISISWAAEEATDCTELSGFECLLELEAL